MDSFRRKYKLEIEDDLRYTRVAIKRSEETIERLQTEDQPFRVEDVLARTEANLKTLHRKEATLMQTLENIEDGLYDAKLDAIRRTNTTQAVETAKKRPTKPPSYKPMSFVGQAASRPTYKPSKEQRREQREKEKEQVREYERYLAECKKLPSVLKKKLETLPNNHGIIFNSILFFGWLPAKEPLSTYVMQEKQGDQWKTYVISNKSKTMFS